MKRKFYLAAMAAIALVACNDRIEIEEQVPEGCVKLALSLDGGETKSVGTNDENRISNVQIFAFDDTGKLEVYKQEKYTSQTVLSSTSSYIYITTGSKKIVTIVNAPDLKVETYEQLKSMSSLMSDNGTRNFQMVGEKDINVVEATEISIPVTRIAAKIVIASITNNMNKFFRDMSFSITNIFMINVVGDTGYLEDKEPETWYNQMKWNDNGSLRFMLDRNSSTTIPVNYSESVTFTQDQEHAYYVYPNSTVTDSFDQETWCPRHTRMILQARLGGDIYYYPITIPNIQRNTAYEVHLTITRPGTLIPDAYVDDVIFSVDVNVVDWNDADLIRETV